MNISILEKPDWVSWESIRECIHKAHETNVSKGMEMKTLQYSATELEARLNKNALDSKVYVALDDEKVIGVAAITIENKTRSCYNGKVGHLHFAAVLPQYRGMDIYGRLSKLRYDFAKNNDCIALEFYTAEKNKKVIDISLSHGFRYVDFIAPSDSLLYYVLLAKNLKGDAFNSMKTRLRFYARRAKLKLLYKPGHIKRFGFLK